jgi:Tfp pilus assembly protein PilO
VRSDRPLWKRRLLPAFLALVALNLLVLAAWTAPRALRLRNATARVEAVRETLEQEQAQAEQVQERASAIDANARDLAHFYESVVGTEQADLLPTLEEIEEMARAPGLSPGRRSFRRDDIEDVALERVSLVLPLEGSYEQLVGFLQEVERSPRFLTVDRISLRGEADREATLQVEMSAFMRLPAVVRGGSGAR